MCTGNQLQVVTEFLKNNVATGSMVSAATGIPQKNFCRYKRQLEKAGKLAEVRNDVCQHTGFRAWYLTTDPTKFPQTAQLVLFL